MKKICIFTGTRAEYGLLQPLMAEIKNDSALCMTILVSGMHLSSEFGMTYRLIEEDGFTIDEKIEILLSSDSSTGLCKSMGLGIIEYAGALERLDPELLVVLGDRFEAFSVVTAALVRNIPVAHIHGGEVTVGAMDDAFRHAITKMSHLHFTCSEEYKKRVIQLGEHPDRVFNVGGLGTENIRKIQLMAEDEVKKKIGLLTRDAYFLVTFHPVTLETYKTKAQFEQLLSALMDSRFKDFKIIITKANADTNGRMINQMIDVFVKENKKQVISFSTMGQLKYLSAMKYAAAVIGNSSSGILEAPAFKIPVVNVGKRQQGRINAENVINCVCRKNDIIFSIEKAISKAFNESIKSMTNPFEQPETATTIKNIIKNFDLSGITLKEFYDYE
ncbi:MAG: UDP-N-acetylglucosamine 2-epimerase [Desulfobacula sp.]|uniref:UDP-N-acetylglucosamine 2-epimerase n=1 Tax=Desulfobacula sp. TaxID=2593537 RepID=UPI0025BCCDEE|nr:UDP-N-acetylglucosamine 2-epimerase [Desulfobacula sp.]MCD4722127.1 UDP-N-acetylglucosamine 2-epimerase [Desulfobacula sp.]